MTTANELLQQGIAAARAGQRAQARQLLVHAIQADRYNEDAWVWLAGVVDDPADMRRCLQQALRINPLNPQARQGIAWLDQRAKQAAQAQSAAGVQSPSAQPVHTDTHAAQGAASQAASHPPETATGQIALSLSDSNQTSSSPSAEASQAASDPHAAGSAGARSAVDAGSNDGSATKPRRRFGLFGKGNADGAAAEEARERPARRFGLFGKGNADGSAVEAASDPHAAGSAGARSAVDAGSNDGSATKPRRWFGRFGKGNADGAAVEAASAGARSAVDAGSNDGSAAKPRRRFGLFGKGKVADDTVEAAAVAEARERPARRFGLFGRGRMAEASLVAAPAMAAAGATAALPASAAPVAAPVAKPHRKEKVLPPEEGDPTRDCCPYCGELNKPDRRWCRRCDRSLMIRGPVQEKRSPWLAILGIFWVIGGILGILGAIAALIGALVMYHSARGGLDGFPLIIAVICVIVALIHGGQIAVARAMMNRARWAYWIIAVLTTLQLGASLIGAFGATVVVSDIITQASMLLPSREAASAVMAITGVIGTVILVDVGIRSFFMLLVGLSWRDFYGPKERFVSEVRGATDYELFNTGLALQRKGMWWMAMKQWEAAVANSPRDTDYLHALTVAYAKLERWDEARETIDRALKVAPDNQALKQIRERIEVRAAG